MKQSGMIPSSKEKTSSPKKTLTMPTKDMEPDTKPALVDAETMTEADGRVLFERFDKIDSRLEELEQENLSKSFMEEFG